MKKHHYWLELREKEIELNFIKLRLNLIQNKKFEKTHATALSSSLFEYSPHLYLFISFTVEMGHIKIDKILAVCTVF